MWQDSISMKNETVKDGTQYSGIFAHSGMLK